MSSKKFAWRVTRDWSPVFDKKEWAVGAAVAALAGPEHPDVCLVEVAEGEVVDLHKKWIDQVRRHVRDEELLGALCDASLNGDDEFVELPRDYLSTIDAKALTSFNEALLDSVLDFLRTVDPRRSALFVPVGFDKWDLLHATRSTSGRLVTVAPRKESFKVGDRVRVVASEGLLEEAFGDWEDDCGRFQPQGEYVVVAGDDSEDDGLVELSAGEALPPSFLSLVEMKRGTAILTRPKATSGEASQVGSAVDPSPIGTQVIADAMRGAPSLFYSDDFKPPLFLSGELDSLSSTTTNSLRPLVLAWCGVLGELRSKEATILAPKIRRMRELLIEMESEMNSISETLEEVSDANRRSRGF